MGEIEGRREEEGGKESWRGGGLSREYSVGVISLGAYACTLSHVRVTS